MRLPVSSRPIETGPAKPQYLCISVYQRRIAYQRINKARIFCAERRSRKKELPWENFLPILARHPLPRPKIMQRYTAVSEALS